MRCCLALVVLFASALDADEPVRILLIGDSTVATCVKPPEDRPTLSGWGQVFGECFGPGVEVNNQARSGASSKSFRAKLWEAASAQPADYLFIQFGHNDQPGKGEDRTTDPNGDYQDNLKFFITAAKAKGMTPILVTSVARRVYREGKIDRSLIPYCDAVKKVAQETNTPVIDLFAHSSALFEKLGDAGSAGYSAGANDRSHFSRVGALVIARLVADSLPAAAPKLGTKVKPAAPSR